MEKHVNNYGGLNKDAGRDVIAPNFYIDAKDIRISTDRGESMGSWTNIKGNKVSFTIPTEQPEGSPFGTWTATNPAIIGHTTIRNKIIVFVADDGGTQGWIYEIQYNNSTLDLLPGYPSLVYYNALLNFSKDWPIEALGHYESDCIQKVYWTDYNNFLRSLNITATDLPLISPGLLDMFPDVTYHQPLLKILTGGGNMMSGVYQVAYRLVTLDGKETLISPPSNFFHIVAQSETNVQSANYFGDNADYNTFKSIQIELNTSDYGEFDKVEFIVIRYPAFNAIPEVLSVEYITINNQPSVTFLYNGDEGSAYPIELVTFITKSYPFKTAKTITKKDSSMVIANIKGAVVSVQDILDPSDTFDAKTGRYNDLGLLPHIGGSETDLLNNAFNITTDSDATRGFNSDAHWDPAWHTSAYQYKYRSNGSTLGGEGPNISYKFHLEPMTIDGNNPTPGFGNVSNIPDGAHYLNDGYGGYANTTYPSFASPFLSGLLRGYKRGETYRFGIVFYTNKGESTFVEYIGDIKFPELGDRNDEVTCNVGGVDYDYYPIALQTTNNDTIGLSLGIQFELDFASCPSLLTQVTSYQIVRVLRAEKDQRRLSQGVIKTFWSVPAGTPADNVDFDLRIPEGVDNGRALHLFPYAGNNSAINGAFTTLVDHKWEPFPQGLTVPKPDLDVDGAYYIKGDYLGFYSPEISYNYGNSRNLIAATSGNNCLLITGAYTNTAQTALDDPKDLSDIDLPQSCRTYGSTMKSTYPVFASDPLQRIKKFVNSKFIEMPDTADYKVTVTPLFAGGPTTGTVGIGQYYMRNYYAIPDYKDSVATLNDPKGSNTGGANLRPEIYKSGSGVIGNIAALILDPLYGTSIPGMGTPGEDFVDYFRSPSITGWNVFFEPIYGGIDPADPITFAPDITLYNSSTPIVDILVPKSETYGGYTLNSLQTNIFSQASPVIDIVHLNPKVYGGDTFITMFTFQAGLVEFNKAFYAKNDSVGNDLYRQSNSVTELFPVESRLNIDLACGSTLKTQAQYTHNGSYYPILKQETNNTHTIALSYLMYGIAGVYDKENKDVIFVPEPSGNTNCLINDVRSYLSNVKINGEILDAWTKFGLNNYYDIDDYGPINKIINFKDTVHFFQDTAVGIYAINRAAITTTNDGVPTQLGTGQGFGKHQYYTKEHGSIHQWGIKATDNGIYFFDAIHKKIFSVSGQEGVNPLSEVKGIHSWLKFLPEAVFWRKENGGDNPILNRGVAIGKDKINDEILFTFLGTGIARTLEINTTYLVGQIVLVYVTGNYYIVTNEFTTGSDYFIAIGQLAANSDKLSELTNPYNDTIVYDDLLQQFSSRFSATPTTYIENGNILMSPNPSDNSTIYTHNVGDWGTFYDNVEEASITLVVNPQSDINKVIRTFEFSSIVRDDDKVIDRTITITAFRVQTEYQDSGKVLFSSGRIKRKFDKWRTKIPRNQSQKDRLRSSYFIVTLYFDNRENKEIIVNRLTSYFDFQMF